MKSEVKRWLASQIAAVPSVRSCLVDREADLVARTWSATVTFIYLLDDMVKPRQLRRILNDNSRIGIGTLFLLPSVLVPPDGARLEPAEALLALHALHHDKLYTYSVRNGAPVIGQVHFKSFGRTHEYEIWYGPAIEIQHLPCYRVWVKSPHSVKGDWLVATFGTETFWKHADYASGRDALRRQQRRGFTHRAAWSNAGWNGGPRFEEEPEVSPTGWPAAVSHTPDPPRHLLCPPRSGRQRQQRRGESSVSTPGPRTAPGCEPAAQRASRTTISAPQ